MEQLRLDFLHILKHALLGLKLSSFEELSPDQWKELEELAEAHKVLPLLFDTVALLPQLQGTEILEHLRRQSRRQIMLQTQKDYDFLGVYEKLREAGATPLVVKGIVCRHLYPQPDLRPSSDEDLLIPPHQLPICHDVLTRHGLQTAVPPEQMEADYEIPYRSATGPLFIELHKQLFPPRSDAYGELNRFFEGVFDRAIRENAVYTLPHTDHLFYLICHAFKHFIHSGFGIRQVCDIILYANAHGSQIDWTRVLDNCRAIQADKFAAAIFQIGSKYLVFDPDKANYPDPWRKISVDELPMLEDLLSAGVYGGADRNRKHSSNITLDAVAAQKQGRKSKNGALTSVFPPASKLEGRYSYLKKRPYLLPVAWCSRLWTYAKETGHDRSSAADALKIGSERINLLREYGILK